MSASLVTGRPVALLPEIVVAVAMEEMAVVVMVAAAVLVALVGMVMVALAAAITVGAVLLDRGILVHRPITRRCVS